MKNSTMPNQEPNAIERKAGQIKKTSESFEERIGEKALEELYAEKKEALEKRELLLEKEKICLLYTSVLNQRIYWLQQKLNQRLKMRPVPRIKFLEEKKTSEAHKIEEILEKTGSDFFI